MHVSAHVGNGEITLRDIGPEFNDHFKKDRTIGSYPVGFQWLQTNGSIFRLSLLPPDTMHPSAQHMDIHMALGAPPSTRATDYRLLLTKKTAIKVFLFFKCTTIGKRTQGAPSPVVSSLCTVIPRYGGRHVCPQYNDHDGPPDRHHCLLTCVP